MFKVTPDKMLKDTTFLTPMYRTWFGEHEKTHELYLNETELEWVEIAPAAKCLPDKGGTGVYDCGRCALHIRSAGC